MSDLTTPSPYLRDGLLTLVDELREQADLAALRRAEADADIRRLQDELAAARALAAQRRDEQAALAESIDWAADRAAELSRLIAPEPDAQLAEAGLMRGPVPEEQQVTGDVVSRDTTQRDVARHDPDDMPFNVVAAPDDVIAALTGGHRAIPDPGPDATSGPSVTMPDPGAAHPVPNPTTPPADDEAGPRHAKSSSRTGGWRTLGGRFARTDDTKDGQQ